MNYAKAINGALMHLRLALLQSTATDDLIIREHMRDAYDALGGDLEHIDAMNPQGVPRYYAKGAQP